ncbi:MAG: caspase family protein [Bacteroidota bacterium]
MRFNKIWTRSLTLFVCFFTSLILQAQDSWIATNYYGVPVGDKQAVFYDEFDNNENNWNLRSNHLDMSIREGELYCKSLNSRTYVKRRYIPFNQTGDYEVEINLRYVNGGMNQPIGLTFGRDIRGNEYNFYFTAEGRFKIMRYHNGRYQNLVNWTNSPALDRYSFNTLTVRKIDSKWYFFVNRNLVHQTVAQFLFGYDAGFTIGGNMTLEVDYLRVSELRHRDSQGPLVSITEPALNPDQKVTLGKNRQVIRGRVKDASGIAEVLINGYKVPVSSSGDFSATVKLPNGTTRIEVKAKDNFDNVTVKAFMMEYYAPVAGATPPAGKPNQNFGKKRGKDYLLMIGIDRYNYWSKLHNATKDCRDIAGLLTTKYQFDRDHTYMLLDNQATRENIIETFETLQSIITPDDNLLVYYAGHGYYDPQTERGYWVPVNARQNKTPDYIRNSTIHDFISGINTHNTFLMIDACYAGSLFGQGRGVVNENFQSRWAFTSGDIQKVWDGQPGENSPFASYLLDYLRNNRKARLRADELIEHVASVVELNTDQNPKGSPLRNVGDKGGVFVFHQKAYMRK